MILFINSLVGIGCIITGFILKATANKDVNQWSGYRTKQSMKNQNTWNEANKYSSKMMIFSGVILLVLSISITYLFKNSGFISSYISFGISLIICVLIPLITTERHLNKLFDENGERRNPN